MGDVRMRGRLQTAATLSVIVACVQLAGTAHSRAAWVPPGDVAVAALDTAVVGREFGGGVAVSAAQVGPYTSTEAGLVDVDCRLRGATGAGTGIVVRSDGVVVTNNHVVASAISITATDLADGRRYPVVVLLRDPGRDVAVIRLVGAAGLAVAPLGNSDRLEVGDPVTALGNAGGRGGPPTVTSGAVTALDRSIVSDDDYTHQSRRLRGMIEVSASMPAGDSGGALLGSSGVVGMNTADGPQSGFAIPINTVLAIARGVETGADGPRGAGGSSPVSAGEEHAVALLNDAHRR